MALNFGTIPVVWNGVSPSIFTIPAAGTVTAYVWGASGSGSRGGPGGYITGSFAVTPGDTVYVKVGGTAGYNGGINNSGGFSSVGFNSASPYLLIAGGGGGSGDQFGGGGGGIIAGAGNNGGGGGTQSLGGAGAGTASLGGNGVQYNGGSGGGGGGGGGGYWGGGGGGLFGNLGGAGGGGSSYSAPSVTNALTLGPTTDGTLAGVDQPYYTAANNQNRNGYVVLVYTESVPGPVVCYAKGTQILTQNGYVAIEDLQPSDLVVTTGTITKNHTTQAKQSLQPIKWKGHFTVSELTEISRPVCIKAHAFGRNMPFEDLFVSPCHRIAAPRNRRNMLSVVTKKHPIVSAAALINGTSIVQDMSCKEVTYYHIELDQHAMVIANGIPAESYLDMKNRTTFTHVASV